MSDDPADKTDQSTDPEDHLVEDQTSLDVGGSEDEPSDTTDDTADGERDGKLPGPGYRRVEDVSDDPQPEQEARKLASLWIEAWENDRVQPQNAATLLTKHNVNDNDHIIEQAERLAREEYEDFDREKLLPPNYTGGPTGDEEIDREYADADVRNAFDDDGGNSPDESNTTTTDDRDRGHEQTQTTTTQTDSMDDSDTSRTRDTRTDDVDVDMNDRPEGIPDDAEDVPDETKTATEAGLQTDDGDVPWLDQSEETEVGQQARHDIGNYKGVEFAVEEPGDEDRYQNHLERLQRLRNKGGERARRKGEAVMEDLAEDLLYVVDSDGEYIPVMDVYYSEYPDGVGRVIPNADREVRAHEETQPLWEGMTWFDRRTIAMDIGEVIQGDKGFRGGRR